MQSAWDSIVKDEEPLFITGRAGTGKTTFLQYIVANLKREVAVCASTGIAAVNAGGVTMHSLFGIPIEIYNPNEKPKMRLTPAKIDVLQCMDVLVIDEVSMVRPDTLDYVNQTLKIVRKNSEPFGGVKVVMFGDLFQLPPVAKPTESTILQAFYSGINFYHAQVFRQTSLRVVELTQVFRQTDEEFIGILNNMRTYQTTDEDIDTLAQTRNKSVCESFDGKHIHICALRREVDKINKDMLAEPTHTYEAKTTGNFPAGNAPAEQILRLREGARVMTLVNSTEDGYCNGSLGVVVGLTDSKVIVELDKGGRVAIEPVKWTAKDYAMENGKLQVIDKGSFCQIPLALAWAITIHKSQGLTFDKVAIHAKFTFCPGQMYVALSRCRSLDGIATDVFVSRKHIIKNEELLRFEKVCSETGYFNLDNFLQNNNYGSN